jgi:hypothetical protein
MAYFGVPYRQKKEILEIINNRIGKRAKGYVARKKINKH